MKSTNKLRWLALLFAWLLGSCHAGEPPKDERSTPHDLVRQSLERALDFSDRVSDFFEGPPRKAPRGAQPELIVENNRITLDGKLLMLDTPVAEWWRTLGPPSRQDRNGRVQVWDELGLGLTTKIDRRTDKTLRGLTEQLYESRLESSDKARERKDRAWNEAFDKARELGNFEVSSFWVDLTGSPSPDDVNEDGEPSPRQAFPGYLEVNGVGVDAKSTLWDVFRWSRKTKYPVTYHCLRLPELRRCTGSAKANENNDARMGFSFSVDETKQRRVTAFSFSCERCPRPAR